MEPKSSQEAILALPLGVITKADAGRLLREIEGIDEFLGQAAIRKPGTTLQLPKTSQLLEEFLSTNKLNALQPPDRQRALEFAKRLYSESPSMHISFATDPQAAFLQKLISWLRKEIHPQLLLSIGVQPNQAAGCVVRTTNKYYDFSLRQRFTDRRGLLNSLLRQDQTIKPTEGIAT